MKYLVALLLIPATAFADPTESSTKRESAFYSKEVVQGIRENIEKNPWAASVRDRIVRRAEPWKNKSDDELWGSMYGNTLPRSWMVWSNGHCPSCKEGVPMYNWKIDAMARPWKVQCPHCDELFPKNDFHAFYRSGLDKSGVFDRSRADRTYLVNTDHADADDPLKSFGVDDGEGFVQGKDTWWFVATYLIYGQWKQVVLGGINRLSAAYVVTGDPVYARKAGILLDRVADLYPTFDFKNEGVLYEGPGSAGYISTWHDSCEETREMVLAYDAVFPGIASDEQLTKFLSEKARAHGLENPKATFADIQQNIEDRILRDAIANDPKIHSNYPRKEIALSVIHTVLGWPENRDEVFAMLEKILDRATAVDGVTGEKGLANYSAFVLQSLAKFLARCSQLDETFLAEMLERNPRLKETYRFHIDTWRLDRYYPQSGDSGWFCSEHPVYKGVLFTEDPELEPSMFSFLRNLYEETGDVDYIRALYHANGRRVEGLPFDLFEADPEKFQEDVANLMESKGAAFERKSVNKEEWRIAILSSGEGKSERALWIDYDSGGGHSHRDGMNLGLFAWGLDLLPDFGYPPVQFDAWKGGHTGWYKSTAAHNTVTVDGRDQNDANGETTLWADGEAFHAIRVSGPDMIDGDRYERTVALVDRPDGTFYALDLFRVKGGSDHAKFVRSHFGSVVPTGLSLDAAEDFGNGTLMRGFETDPSPETGWRIDWEIEDRYGLLPEGEKRFLRYLDLSPDAEASLAESWVIAGGYSSLDEAWVPTVMVRRQNDGEARLESTFVSLYEPHKGTPSIQRARALPLLTEEGTGTPTGAIAVEVTFADGSLDLIYASDPESEGAGPRDRLVQPDWKMTVEGDLCLARKDAEGNLERVAMTRVRTLEIGDRVFDLVERPAYVEMVIEGAEAKVVAGDSRR